MFLFKLQIKITYAEILIIKKTASGTFPQPMAQILNCTPTLDSAEVSDLVWRLWVGGGGNSGVKE